AKTTTGTATTARTSLTRRELGSVGMMMAAASTIRKKAMIVVMCAKSANESAEAPASTDGANLKLQGQSLALTPVASSGWFGGMVITLNTHCHGSTSVPFELKCRQA